MNVSEYPTVDFTGDHGESSKQGHPYHVTSVGMQVYQSATVNGGPVSNSIIGNDQATIYGISLTKYAGPIYEYLITVDGKGPKGITGGSFYLAFTDESGDTYYLSLYSSTRKQHTVAYNSEKPNIVKIWWSDYHFHVESANNAKADFKVTSPASE
jgi:hypothetical protein